MKSSKIILSAGAALASCLFGSSAHAAVTPYSWIRAGELGNVFLDSSGTGHPFNAAFSSGCNPADAGGGGNPAAVIVQTGVGGPLGGPGGPISTSSTRWGSFRCGNSGMWIQGPNNSLPTPAQWSLPATDWVMEAWVLPQGTGASGGRASSQFLSTGSPHFGGVPGGARFVTQYNPGDQTISIKAMRIGPGINDDIGEAVITDTTHWIHVAVVNSGGVTTFYANGVPSGEPRSDVTPPSGIPYVGSGEDTGGPFDGFLDEVRFSTFTPGAFQVTDLLLRPAGPSVLAQPQPLAVWEGGAAPFEVRTAIDPDLGYQWRRDGVNLIGEVSEDLFLPNVAASENGHIYSVLLSSGGVDVTSVNAPITVVPQQTANANFYKSAVQSESSLVAFFPVDGSSGATVANLADPSHPGSLSFENGYDSRTNRSFGERALRFTGANDVTIANNPAFEFSGGEGTIEAVAFLAPPASSGVGTLFSLASGPTISYYQIQANLDGSALLFKNDQGANISWPVPTSLLGRSAHIAIVFAPGTVTAFVDGESLGAKANIGFGAASGLAANIGSLGRNASDVLQDPWVGTIDELAIYSKSLSANTIAIHNSRYLYGTAVTAPSISSAPSGSKSLLAGGAPVFRVAASGTAPLSYVWKKNGSAIVGNPTATTSTLRLDNSTVDMSGSYTVTVSNPIGDATSEPFTVTFTAPGDSYASAVLADNPSAYWRLNESSGTVMKDSAGGNDGTYSSTVVRSVGGAPGTGDTAAKFAGGGSPVANAIVPFTPTLNPTTPYTIEFWAKPDRSGSTQGAVVGNQNRNAGRAGYAVYQGFNVPAWEAHIGFENSVLFIQGNTPTEAGRWDHVVVTWDGVSVARIYVNGVDDTSAGSSTGGPTRPNLSVPLEIGSRFNGGVPFPGVIDEVAFYNHALTPEQIRDHWKFSWVAPAINGQPATTLKGTEAKTITLSTQVIGYPNTYQWFKDGEALVARNNPDGSAHFTGINSPTLVITQSTPDDAGSYQLQVTNPLNLISTVPTDLTIDLDTTSPQIANVTADSSMRRVRVTFDRWINPDTAVLPQNYGFDGGVTPTGVVLTSDPSVVDVTVTGLAADTQYTLTVSGVRDQRTSSNLIGANSTSFRTYVLTKGAVAWDFYAKLSVQAGVPNTSVARLMNDPQYPDGVFTNGVLSSFSTLSLTGGDLNSNPGFGPRGLGSDYGIRLYAWITPEVSGNYTFFLRSDDASELWMSPDADPASGLKSLIAFEAQCCEGFKEPAVAETSSPIALNAGESYYIEAFNTEGGGGDYVEVAWRLEGDSTPAGSLKPISGSVLSAYAPRARLTTSVADGKLSIKWTDGGTLEESSDLVNWSPVAGNPASGYTVTPVAGTAKFYRVRR